MTAAERGKGVGRALVARCVEEARRRGCHQVRLEAGNWRGDAHEFYTHLGFEELAKSFRLRL